MTDEPDGEVRSPAPNSGGGRLRWVLWLLGLLAAVPVIVTLIGAATSPPHATGVPVGHLVYLDADQPSEKTTILRGLYITQPGGPPRLLVHEEEPQDTDSGVRQWITEPSVSPDGTQVAYIQQNITLLEETHTQVTQLWVMPLLLPDAKPRLLLDLTKLHLKQCVGLTWTPCGKSVVLLNDSHLVVVPTASGAAPASIGIVGPPLRANADVSATQNPTLSSGQDVTRKPLLSIGSDVTCTARMASGAVETFCDGIGYGGVDVYRLSTDRKSFAFVPEDHPRIIRISQAGTGLTLRDIPVRWGWSIFGRRHITSLRWSPDGKYIGFTVSKPPVPEDELFYLDIATGKTFQLPVRTGRAAWDWTR